MAGAPRVSVDELKRRIDAGEEIAILDMRKGSWNRSDVKITGAIRMTPDELDEPGGKVSPDVPIVSYCT